MDRNERLATLEPTLPRIITHSLRRSTWWTIMVFAILAIVHLMPAYYIYQLVSGDLDYDIEYGGVVIRTRTYEEAYNSALLGAVAFVIIAVICFSLFHHIFKHEYRYSVNFIKNWEATLPAIDRSKLDATGKAFIESREVELQKHLRYIDDGSIDVTALEYRDSLKEMQSMVRESFDSVMSNDAE